VCSALRPCDSAARCALTAQAAPSRAATARGGGSAPPEKLPGCRMTVNALQAASSQPNGVARFPPCSPVLPARLGRSAARPERVRRARRARRCCRTTCAWSPRPPPRPPSSCRTPRGARRLAPAAPGAPPRPGRRCRALASCAHLRVPERAGAHGRSAGAHGAMHLQRFKRILLGRAPMATDSLRLGVAASRGAGRLRPPARVPATQLPAAGARAASAHAACDCMQGPRGGGRRDCARGRAAGRAGLPG
jgi:hypothetical protein